jgi:RNA polymerase sigma-70 factor, ECF subfamily
VDFRRTDNEYPGETFQMQEDQGARLAVGRRDPAAFERIYAAHFVRVRDFLRIYLGGGTIVEDVAQETFLHFWKRPNGFNPARSSIREYLFGIARKRAVDWWRATSGQRPS